MLAHFVSRLSSEVPASTPQPKKRGAEVVQDGCNGGFGRDVLQRLAVVDDGVHCGLGGVGISIVAFILLKDCEL